MQFTTLFGIGILLYFQQFIFGNNISEPAVTLLQQIQVPIFGMLTTTALEM